MQAVMTEHNNRVYQGFRPMQDMNPHEARRYDGWFVNWASVLRAAVIQIQATFVSLTMTPTISQDSSTAIPINRPLESFLSRRYPDWSSA